MKIGEYFESFKSLWGVAAVAAGAGPLGLWVADLEPPWPSAAGKVATLFCAIAILIAFFVGPAGSAGGRKRKGGKKKSGVRYAAIALLVVGSCGVISYLWAYGRYVVTDSVQRGGRTEIIRMVVGTELRPGLDASQTTKLELLRDNLYDPEEVWTSESVNNTRQLLVVWFVLSFFLLTFGAALLAKLGRETSTET